MSVSEAELYSKAKYPFLHSILFVERKKDASEFLITFNTKYIKTTTWTLMKIIQFFELLGLNCSNTDVEITNTYDEDIGRISVGFFINDPSVRFPIDDSPAKNLYEYISSIKIDKTTIGLFPLTEAQKEEILQEINIPSQILKAGQFASDQLRKKVRIELDTIKLQGRNGKVYDSIFSNFKDEFRAAFGLARISPGSTVGMLATESTSEPITQATMKTFQVAGTATNLNYGLAQLIETLNVSKKISQEVMIVHMRPDLRFRPSLKEDRVVQPRLGPSLIPSKYTYNDIIYRRKDIVSVTIGSLYAEPPLPEIVSDDVPFYYNLNFLSERLILKGWFLRLKFNVNELYRYQISLIEIKNLIKNKADKVYKSINILTSSLSEGIIDIFPITSRIVETVREIVETKTKRPFMVEDEEDAEQSIQINETDRERFRTSFHSLSDRREQTERELDAIFLSSIVQPAIKDLIIQGVSNVSELQPVLSSTLSIVGKENKIEGEGNFLVSFNERKILANNIPINDYVKLMTEGGIQAINQNDETVLVRMPSRDLSISRILGPPSSHGIGYLKALIKSLNLEEVSLKITPELLDEVEKSKRFSVKNIPGEIWELRTVIQEALIPLSINPARAELLRYLNFNRFEILKDQPNFIRLVMPWNEWPLLNFLKEKSQNTASIKRYKTAKNSIKSIEILDDYTFNIQLNRNGANIPDLKEMISEAFRSIPLEFIRETYSSLFYRLDSIYPHGIPNYHNILIKFFSKKIADEEENLMHFSNQFIAEFDNIELVDSAEARYALFVRPGTISSFEETKKFFNQANLKWNHPGEGIFWVISPMVEEKPAEFINKKLKAEENELKAIRIREIKGMEERIRITPLEKAANYAYSTTIGNNLREILCNRYVDPTRTYSNNSHDVYRYFGIEAVRVYLYKNIMDILEHLGSALIPLHISVITDYMTLIGDPIALTNTGVTKLGRYIRGFLTPASVAFAGLVVKNAALAGSIDPLTSISAKIYVAAPGSFGSNTVSVPELDAGEMDETRKFLENISELSISEFSSDFSSFISNIRGSPEEEIIVLPEKENVFSGSVESASLIPIPDSGAAAVIPVRSVAEVDTNLLTQIYSPAPTSSLRLNVNPSFIINPLVKQIASEVEVKLLPG